MNTSPLQPRYQAFLEQLGDSNLADWARLLPADIARGLNEQRYGDLPRWRHALETLPVLEPDQVLLNQPEVSVQGPITAAGQQQLRTALEQLHPWRKGPFNLFGVTIDTEWRSDWKWQRLADAIDPLTDRQVLDVGCGSGYHCWRMRGAGASRVIGIDPGPLFVCQFFALQHYIQDHRVGVLPLRCEQLPTGLKCFDTTFSMGVLYHRRSPLDHLLELRDTLRPGGQLVLETLVIDGAADQLLMPADRYARMGNVWFIPAPGMLQTWLAKTGFVDIRLVDVSKTSTDEQRQTAWMRFHSLAQFLDPANPDLTVEGYPAPRRAIVTARVPG